ncbi:hypothetical protein ACIPWF_17205 [Paenarthrobacter sp. NPDC089989]|uniref:hypothetical protein n=1 Tax=unclassified Paenarthrobacter TaxID=2634190 RepID=UPI0037FF69F1
MPIPSEIPGSTARSHKDRFPFRSAIAFVAVAALLIVLNYGPAVIPSPDSTQAAPELPRYPISGFFISSSATDAKNLRNLEEIKASGGDTVITFGTSIVPASADSLPTDCKIDGDDCASVIGAGLKINRYFTYSDGGQWGKAALKCPRDRYVENQGKSYTIMVFPSNDTGCTAKDGRYDIIVAGGSPLSATDRTVSLASAASKLGMKFYAGMPAPAKRTDFEYLPDTSFLNTFTAFTDRFLRYQAQANNADGLTGFYHHLEMPVTDNPFFEPVLSLYKMQNQAIHRILPGRSAIVSPYIEARKDSANITPENAKNGIRKIAQTSGGLHLSIAIQDGMGTGKGAAYSAAEAGSPVDEFAASIVGNGTWAEKYVAPNRDYFKAAAQGIVGTGADLWANMEGMAPATKANPCDKSLRGQTTADRIGTQLQQLGSAQKIISYMWDPYFTCSGANPPLRDTLLHGLGSPLVTDSSYDAATGELRMEGFNLSGSTYTFELTGSGEADQRISGEPDTVEASSGEPQTRNPRLETITITTNLKQRTGDDSYAVSVSNEWGTSSDTGRPKSG